MVPSPWTTPLACRRSTSGSTKSAAYPVNVDRGVTSVPTASNENTTTAALTVRVEPIRRDGSVALDDAVGLQALDERLDEVGGIPRERRQRRDLRADGEQRKHNDRGLDRSRRTNSPRWFRRPGRRRWPAGARRAARRSRRHTP